MLPPDAIIGIDLGTTNSCAAAVVGDGQVNVEGILTMSARDPETGRQMKTTVRVQQD